MRQHRCVDCCALLIPISITHKVACTMLVLRPRIVQHIAGLLQLRSVATSPCLAIPDANIPVQPGDTLAIHAECSDADISIHQSPSHDSIHVEVCLCVSRIHARQGPPGSVARHRHHQRRCTYAQLQGYLQSHSSTTGIHLPATAQPCSVVARIPERYCGVTVAMLGGAVRLQRITEAPLDITTHGAHAHVGSVKVFDRQIGLRTYAVCIHTAVRPLQRLCKPAVAPCKDR